MSRRSYAKMVEIKIGSDKNGQSTKYDKYKLVDYDLIKNTLNSL